MADEFEEVIEGEAEELNEADSERQVLSEELDEAHSERQLLSEEVPAIAGTPLPPDRPGARFVPAVQAAALAATGFAVGAAAAALVKRRSAGRLRRSRVNGLRRSPEGLPVISTHTYLVRVQVLGRPAD